MIWIGIPMAIIGALAWFWLNMTDGNPLGGLATPDGGDLFVVVYGYLTTVVGVFLGSGYRYLEKLRSQDAGEIPGFGRSISHVARSIDLWMALLASPVVFALIWKTMDRTSYSSITIIALENGFACLAVISMFVKKDANSTRM